MSICIHLCFDFYFFVIPHFSLVAVALCSVFMNSC